MRGYSWASRPDDAVRPFHGIARDVLIDSDMNNRAGRHETSLAPTPETIVVDHGMFYLSEHLNSVCQRTGITVQPRLVERSDTVPLQPFFDTARAGLR
jgi:putative aminopeptidase FrvX